MINILMLALALASPGALAQTPTPTPTPTPNPALVRVFVETDVGGQASELAGRRQSVKDLAAALASKKKTMILVDREDAADLVLEVLSRGVTVPKVVFGLGPRPGEPIGMSGPVRVVVLRVQLTFGREVLSFANKNKPAEAAPGWKSAADDIGDQVAKWAAEHHAEILAQRKLGDHWGTGLFSTGFNRRGTGLGVPLRVSVLTVLRGVRVRKPRFF